MSVLSYSIVDKTLSFAQNNVSVSKNNREYTFGFPCGDHTSLCTPYEVSLNPGLYKFEVWGAEGGSSCWGGKFSQSGGRGGYSIGSFHTIMKTKLYVYIGGKGTSANNEYVQREGGYNGGGIGGTDSSKLAGSAGGGGGATDIRRALDALYERIIVAGGGSSGNTFYPNMGGLGAAGGGELGEDGSYNSQYVVNGKGGSQTQGGEAFTARGATSGTFGFGGNGSTGYSSNGGSAGGGGYFGGGAGSSTHDHGNPDGVSGTGGGGSGYIGGVFDFPRSSKKKMTISGNSNFPSPNGNTELGHLGNGACKITVLSYFCSITLKRRAPSIWILLFVLLLS